MDTIRGHIKRIPERLAPKIDGIKTNFDEWKVPWTEDRAEKIDNLDVPVSSRASQGTLEGVSGVLGDSSARDLSTVMGRLGSIVGYDEQVVYDVPGTYDFIVPDGVTSLTVTVASAGGGGGGGAGTYTGRTFSGRETGQYNSSYYDLHPMIAQSYGGSGASGGITQRKLKVNPGDVYKVVVGQGGTGGTARGSSYGGNGLAGGSSSFGTVLSVSGGAGGGGGALRNFTYTTNAGLSAELSRTLPSPAVSGKVLNTETSDDIYRLDGNDGGKPAGIHFRCVTHEIARVDDRTVTRNRYPISKTLGTGDWTRLDTSEAVVGEGQELPFNVPRFTLPIITVPGARKVGALSADYGAGGEGGSWGQWADITLLSSTLDESNNFYNYTWKTGTNSTAATAGRDGKNGIVIIDY